MSSGAAFVFADRAALRGFLFLARREYIMDILAAMFFIA
jgi:hypothetical protein